MKGRAIRFHPYPLCPIPLIRSSTSTLATSPATVRFFLRNAFLRAASAAMAELVTSMVIGPLVSMVKDKVSSYLLDEYKVMEGMEEQREILERQLPAILQIIDDAEEKGAQPGVGAWLKALKKASYEANDVFDEFKYEALAREARKRGHRNTHGMDVVSLLPACNSIMFRRRMGKKLQKIVQDIEVLVTKMNDFGFSHRPQKISEMPLRQMDHVMIDSEKDIVSRSRTQEKKKIMKILLDHANNDDLLVLPIVGLGGLGKTTFVQLVYSDPEIEKHFQFLKWYCVSDDFDVGNIARSICNSTKKDSEKVLQDLQKELSGKRCLLVLDDIWNQDVNKWEKLKTCLQHAGTGSAILTTTRDAKIAQIMSGKSGKIHNLENLDDVHLKEILERRAFILQKPEFARLDDIVNEIVKRCAGSPLAAKAIGSMLRTKTSKEEWMVVSKKSSICNEETGILPILKLSFDNLPFHMKQCFAFCAVFPKDYEINVDNLIQLWMANDYVPVEEDVPLETTGRHIFNELAWRSFFQDALEDQNWSHFRSIKTCKIHDLMHDIALSVLGEECATITNRFDQKKLLSKHCRHLFSSYDETAAHLIAFLKKQAPTLQTLLLPLYADWTSHMPKYNSLRAIRYPRRSEFKIRSRKLQHLRYLDLSGNWRIKQLPEEISIMYNLQTLNVSGCKKLCRLPRDMKYMASLRHLYTEGCTSLKCMPSNLGELTSLCILTYFVAGASSGCSTIGELQNLDLGDKLMLSYLENVTEAQARAATLGNKEKLRHLSLEWSSECHEEPVSDCHKKVLDALKPHEGLETLRIQGYKSTSLPTWMKDLSFLQKHLTELRLVGFTVCEEFPQFSHFEALQILRLEGLEKLESLCSNEASLTFPKLKKLKLLSLKNMERWVAAEGREGEVAFPQLQKLVIQDCPKLVTLPETPNLKDVVLDEGKAQLLLLIARCGYMSLLSTLELHVRDKEAALELDSENVESHLLELTLNGCDFFFLPSPRQPTFMIWRWFGKLVSLDITGCDALIYWPEVVFQSLVSLKRLYVSKCHNLVGPTQVKCEPAPTTSQVLPRLNALSVKDCQNLTELFVLPPSITSLQIWSCEKLEFTWEDTKSKSVRVEQLGTSTSMENCASTSVPKQPATPAQTNHPLPCLEYIFIVDLDSLVTLPNLPPALKALSILSCEKLCFVSGQLDVLEHLDISGCNKLQSLNSLGNLPSLQSLTLDGCKSLISVPGAVGSYSALQRLTIKYCPAIDTKSLYKQHKQRLDNLEERDLSHAHSSDPLKETSLHSGPKLMNPRTWKYAIPQRWR
ncbi:putative disease resistance protein RGA1 isoform X3 [Sorghum bicolor]|nr:putative disease resistance protein RGA1 isoform X3 [Sorghum bicolor]|eukprot:XP_021320902.1 putative disease resistance protein RGA1 isoform X3 [Sorghum bicolor]